MNKIYYFAYGSNMSCKRLELRVGKVSCLGLMTLDNHRHRFSKEGVDKTGKGNIEDDQDSKVHGVVYEMTLKQFETLKKYESGYDICQLNVFSEKTGPVEITAFKSHNIKSGLLPTLDYWKHYQKSFSLFDFPKEYIRDLRNQKKNDQ